jgi:hypothetical protein
MHQVQRLVAEPAESPSSTATTPAAIPITPFQVIYFTILLSFLAYAHFIFSVMHMS